MLSFSISYWDLIKFPHFAKKGCEFNQKRCEFKILLTRSYLLKWEFKSIWAHLKNIINILFRAWFSLFLPCKNYMQGTKWQASWNSIRWVQNYARHKTQQASWKSMGGKTMQGAKRQTPMKLDGVNMLLLCTLWHWNWNPKPT